MNNIKKIITEKASNNIDMEVSSFFKRDISTFLKNLKSIHDENNISYYNKIDMLTNLSKFFGFLVKDVDFTLIGDLVVLKNIGNATYLTKIAPEINDILLLEYAKTNNMSQKIIDILQNLSNTNIGKVILLAENLLQLTINALNSTDYVKKTDDVLNAIIELDINISLIAMIHKSISLFKKQKNIKKIEEQIRNVFMEEYVSLYGKNGLTNDKKISLNVVYKKSLLIKKFPNEYKVMQDFYKKIDGAKPSKKAKKDNIEGLKKQIKETSILLKNNKNNNESIIEIIVNFINKYSFNDLNRKQIIILLKVKKKFQKYSGI
ncbi:MAG: hypothetical protein LBT02_00655 [Rickettsiales bacterium]|jgi:hypothetical protein|nr:hypothetical protein [Rickettsiales bacterium]